MIKDIQYTDKDTALVTAVSKISGKERVWEMPITSDQIYDWKANNRKIQDVFPHLSADQREFLISGVTPWEWDKLFNN